MQLSYPLMQATSCLEAVIMQTHECHGRVEAVLARMAEAKEGLICTAETFKSTIISSNEHSLVQEAKRQHSKVHKSSVVRLAGVGIARLVAEEDKVVLYHCLANNNERHASGQGGCEGENQVRAS